MQDSDFITALKLRTNTLPTLAMKNRGRGSQAVTLCRACGSAKETIRHIISHCMTIQKLRMENHNKVVRLLANTARRHGWDTIQEPRLRNESGRLGIPDLVASKDK